MLWWAILQVGNLVTLGTGGRFGHFIFWWVIWPSYVMVGNFVGGRFGHLMYWWGIWSFYVLVGDFSLGEWGAGDFSLGNFPLGDLLCSQIFDFLSIVQLVSWLGCLIFSLVFQPSKEIILNCYLSFQKAVEKSSKKALKADKKGCTITPNGKVDSIGIVGCSHHLQTICDP